MELNFTHKIPKKFNKQGPDALPRIVLLHGWAKTASSKSFQELQEKLAKLGFETWAIDLPGFGESPAAPEYYGIAEFAKEVADFIKKNVANSSEQEQGYYLFGHSFGGSLSAYIAAKLEPKPTGIILCNSAGIRYKTLKAKILLPFAKTFKMLRKILPEKLYLNIRKNIYYYFIRERDYVDTSDKKEQFVRVTNDDISDTFRQVRVPTLIIWGKDDKITPLSMGKKIHALIENSKLEIIDGRHGIPITKAEEVAQIVNDYIKKED